MRFLLLLWLYSFSVFAQEQVILTYEPTKTGYKIYAQNKEFIPVTMVVHFQMKNLKIKQEKNFYVIPAQSEKKLIAEMSVEDNRFPYQFTYTYLWNYGDFSIDKVSEHVYDLPYQVQQRFRVMQGYNGTFSHQNEYSLDFDMPVGTGITAVRDGIVVKIEDRNSQRCIQKECAQFNNYVLIFHEDGTFSEFSHLDKEGVLVKPGDKVAKGQLIAKSGNTGWSTAPHLHLVIFKQKLHQRETLPTPFRISDGTVSEILQEGKIYTRNY